MEWKAPSFWWSPHQKWRKRLLYPVAFLFRLGAWVRHKIIYPEKAPFPVISIGNLVLGGAGKTPTVLALARYFKEKGATPLVFLRGYGGELKKPTLVDPSRHTVAQVGDEAFLIAQHYATYISRRRKDILPLLHDAPEPSVILLDDGHQHHSLFKDLSLVVIDGHQKFGNGALFPAGPLRESIATGLKRASAFIVVGNVDKDFLEDLQDSWPYHTLLQAQLKPLTALPVGTCVFGFSGIGYPYKFLKTLQDMALNIMGFQSFPDHYVYKEEDLLTLREKAMLSHATLVTTKKDLMRIPVAYHADIQVIDVELVFESLESLGDVLKGFYPAADNTNSTQGVEP